MEKTVFLFGAGASHGAREPRPPLGKDLHNYVLRYLNAAWDELSELDTEATDVTIRRRLKELLTNAPSFERLVTCLRGKRPDHAVAERLNRLMARALTPPINDDPRVDEAFVEKSDLYDRLLKCELQNLQRPEDVTFITLNYDCLLERAVCRAKGGPRGDELQCACKHVDYRFWDEVSDVEVLKPHGSINWVGDEEAGGGAPLSSGAAVPLPVAAGPRGVFTYRRIKLAHTPQDEPGETIVAHYARGKDAQANPSTLERIRRLSIERARHAARVVIIGVHLPPDPDEDPPLCELLREVSRRATQGCSVEFVSPGEDGRQRACALGFTPTASTFEEYVASRR